MKRRRANTKFLYSSNLPTKEIFNIPKNMDLFMFNEGLIHISEAIFGNLEDDELIKCLPVCKSWYDFINSYGRKRLIKKLDVILSLDRYDRSYHQSDFLKNGWKKRFFQTMCNISHIYFETFLFIFACLKELK